MFCAKNYEECNADETAASKNLQFSKGINRYPNNYGPS